MAAPYAPPACNHYNRTPTKQADPYQ
jgi:hypothetical protein